MNGYDMRNDSKLFFFVKGGCCVSTCMGTKLRIGDFVVVSVLEKNHRLHLPTEQ